MATSRTGTTTYLANSNRAKRQAQRSGLTHCPGIEENNFTCGVELDYRTPRLPNSAETDHVIEHARGGTDALANLRVICRTCNLVRNRRTPPPPPPGPDEFPTSRAW
jgi:5-methylcytosine-specific restriction endonuclease McrA